MIVHEVWKIWPYTSLHIEEIGNITTIENLNENMISICYFYTYLFPEGEIFADSRRFYFLGETEVCCSNESYHMQRD